MHSTRYEPVSIFLLLGWLVFSVIIIIFSFEQDRNATFHHFENDVNQFTQKLVSRLQANTAIIDSLSSQVISVGAARTRVLRKTTQNLLAQYPHIYAFEIAEKVNSTSIPTFEKLKRNQGIDGFKVKSFSYDADRKWIAPDISQGIHYPLVLLEPELPETRDIYGLDVWSVPNLKTAMEQSRLTKRASSSTPFNLVEGDRAYVLFKPIYLSADTDKETLSDYPTYYGLLVVLSSSLIPTERVSPGLSYKLYHSSFAAKDPKGNIFHHAALKDSSSAVIALPKLTYSVPINISGQNFTLNVEKQMQWDDLSPLRFTLVITVSLLALTFTLMFIRSRRLLDAVRGERDQAMYGLAKLDFSGSIEDIYNACVENLSQTYHAQYAFIGLFADENKTSIQTQAVWAAGNLADNFKYDLEGTPCADILNLSKELIPRDAAKLYPEDTMLIDMGVESYYGSPLVNTSGEIIGLVSVLDTKPMELSSWTAPMLGIFSERISAEIERHGANESLQNLNNELEQRIHDRTEEYRKAKQDAEDANKAKSEFLSRMSHEFRTPMNAVLGFSQLMEIDGELDGRNKDNVNEIILAGRHMLGLIDEVLDLSAIESGTIKMDFQDISAKDVVNSTLSLVRPIADNNTISLHCPSNTETDILISADKNRLTEVVLNLLSNAIKYNHAKGKVWIDCDKDEDFFYLNVHDNGSGLTEENMENIFEPFNRAGAEASQVSGTGIGLSISRELMILMGGNISVISNPGVDTCFTIKIPLAKPAD